MDAAASRVDRVIIEPLTERCGQAESHYVDPDVLYVEESDSRVLWEIVNGGPHSYRHLEQGYPFYLGSALSGVFGMTSYIPPAASTAALDGAASG